MAALNVLLTIVAIPLMILNMLGGIVSGIWLVVLGEWGAIGYGILALVVSSFVLTIALLPSVGLGLAGAHFLERGISFLFYVFALLSSCYVVVLMALWCGAVLYFFASRATSDSWIPLLIWSYGVALGPWMWMARKEVQGGGGDASSAVTFFAQIGYIVMVLMAVFMSRPTIVDLLQVFLMIMVVGVIFQFAVAIAAMRESSALGFEE